MFDKKIAADRRGMQRSFPAIVPKKRPPTGIVCAAASKKVVLTKPVAAVLPIPILIPIPAPAPTPPVIAKDDASWCVAYRPTQVEHAVLQPDTARTAVERWLRRRLTDNDPKGQKVLLLKGPSGCGKASFIRAVAATLGHTVEEPEGVDTFNKLLTVVREGACAHTLPYNDAEGPARGARRVWLFSGIDGYAEDDDAAAPETKRRRPAGDVLERLIHCIKTSFLPRKSEKATAMAPIVLTLQDFSNKTVRRLQNLEAIFYVTALPLDRDKCRYALTRIRDMAPDVSAVIGTADVDAVVTYCYGDVRQCVLELQKTYYSKVYDRTRCSSTRHTKHHDGGKDVVSDVFETARRLLAVDRDVDIESITSLLAVHANGMQFLFSNWMFNLDFGVRRMAAQKESAAMQAVALGCDAWCRIHEASAWRLGREPSFVQTECGVIAGVMQLRETRNVLDARTPTKLDYYKPLQRKGLPVSLDAVRTASLNSLGLKMVDLNERLCCACAIASCISRGICSLPPASSTIAAVPGTSDDYPARLTEVCVEKTSTQLVAVDPFFANYGIPRHIAVAALPGYDTPLVRSDGSAAVVLASTDWKILDGDGWKRQYRPGYTGVSARVREAELTHLRNCTPAAARDTAAAFVRIVCEPLRADAQAPHMTRETFLQTMADYNAVMDLLNDFYIEHGLEM